MTITSRQQSGAFVATFSLETATEGPLRGLRFAVKNLIDVAGHWTTCGNPSWRDSHPPATVHAVSVEQLLAAGARCVGKTVTDERLPHRSKRRLSQLRGEVQAAEPESGFFGLRLQVEKSPAVPTADRRIGLPAVADLQIVLLAVSVAKVVQTSQSPCGCPGRRAERRRAEPSEKIKNIWARPSPDAFDLDQLLDHIFVVHPTQLGSRTVPSPHFWARSSM